MYSRACMETWIWEKWKQFVPWWNPHPRHAAMFPWYDARYLAPSLQTLIWAGIENLEPPDSSHCLGFSWCPVVQEMINIISKTSTDSSPSNDNRSAPAVSPHHCTVYLLCDRKCNSSTKVCHLVTQGFLVIFWRRVHKLFKSGSSCCLTGFTGRVDV